MIESLNSFLNGHEPIAMLQITRPLPIAPRMIFFAEGSISKLSMDQISDQISDQVTFGHITFEGEEHFTVAKNWKLSPWDETEVLNSSQTFYFDQHFNNSEKIKVHSAEDHMVNTQELWENYKKSFTAVKNAFTGHPGLKKIILKRDFTLKLSKPWNFQNLQSLKSLLSIMPPIECNHHFLLYRYYDSLFISYGPETLGAMSPIGKNSPDQYFYTQALAGSMPHSKSIDMSSQQFNVFLNDPLIVNEHTIVKDSILKTLKEYAPKDFLNLEMSPPEILTQKYIHHMNTNFTMPLSKSFSRDIFFNLIQRLHPTPALGGEPRELALKIIGEIEINPRNFYGGAFGFFHPDFSHFLVGIRSILLQSQNTLGVLSAGGGLLPQSVLEKEWEETTHKMQHFLSHFSRNEV